MDRQRRQQVQFLLAQYIGGITSPGEEALFFRFLKEGEEEDNEWQELIEELMAAEPEDPVYEPDRWAPVIDHILEKHRERPADKPGRIRWVQWLVAASVIMALSVGVFFILNKKEQPPVVMLQPEAIRFKNDIAPGHEGAILTLSDGRQVILDSAHNGTLAIQGNSRIIKQDGQLSYTKKGEETGVIYNTMTTPRGRQYRLLLGDGTAVWLNAGSSITYPVVFSGPERKVSVTGEAYFEVAHNAALPFIVEKGGLIVQVLGTHFNINAYDDEGNIRTTLLEGSVKISHPGTGARVLSPGQQAALGPGSKLTISSPDLREVTAWKNGLFSFSNATIESIMRQVARWYDVDVSYAGKITQPLNGRIPRSVNVADLFRILESTGWVHFSIDGRKITVMP